MTIEREQLHSAIKSVKARMWRGDAAFLAVVDAAQAHLDGMDRLATLNRLDGLATAPPPIAPTDTDQRIEAMRLAINAMSRRLSIIEAGAQSTYSRLGNLHDRISEIEVWRNPS